MKRIAVVVFVLLWGLGGTAQAWRPSAWVWGAWPYVYSNADEEWLYLEEGGSQWCLEYGTWQWSKLGDSALATGWAYYSWPYAYSLASGTWFYINEVNVLYGLSLFDGQWSRFGTISGMARIPGGAYVRGDGQGLVNVAKPAHTVTVSTVYMDRLPVTKAQWDEVRAWGLANGFTDLSVGEGGRLNLKSPLVVTNGGVITTNWTSEGGPSHPVVFVTWYDIAKWCNARSLKAGLTPPYYTDAAHTTVYRTGQVDLANNQVDWSCTGYRLPTEAEWEKGARGGLHQQHFPWPSEGTVLSNLVDGAKANYYASGDAFESGTTPAGYYDGRQVATNAAGAVLPAADMGGGYGIYDMAGNVWEWCWDWYASTTYQAQVDSNDLVDPRGPDTGDFRADRGGSWLTQTSAFKDLRCATRYGWVPHVAASQRNRGFRAVRRP